MNGGEQRPRRLLVAVRDMAYVRELVPLAFALARTFEAEVIALYVVVVPLRLPLDAPMEEAERSGEEVLALARRLAEEDLGLKLSTRLIRAREVGGAIVEEAERMGASWILLGYRRKKRVRQKMLGPMLEYVLWHAPCQVLLSVTSEWW